MWTLELPEQVAIVAKYRHVEPVPVAVTNQNVSRIWNNHEDWRISKQNLRIFVRDLVPFFSSKIF